MRDLNTAGKNDMLKRPYAGKGGKTGVGTVAQISTQAQEYLTGTDGRRLNRRVELVSRLK